MTKWTWVALAVAATAQAAEVSGESPRNMLVEVKLSPYTPLIDRSFPDTMGPYQKVYGGAPMLMGELELDYELFQKMGSLSVGFSVGYAEKFARAFDDNGQPAAQSTGLMLAPLKALLVYRFDWLSLHQGIPLVPYAKAAFVAIPWWVTAGGEVEVAQGLRGAGVKYGLAGVLGVAVTLDFLDTRLARDFDTSVGVNHSYLFGEFTLQETGLFQSPGLDLSSRHWMFGLGLEF